MPARSWIATVQTVVGAFVDGARSRVVGMTLAEGDEVPHKVAIRVLRQLEHETEGRLGCSLPPKRHVKLRTARESRPALSVGFALPQVKSRFPAFDFSKSALSLDTRRRAPVQALDLFCPLLAVESDRDRRKPFSFARANPRRRAGGGRQRLARSPPPRRVSCRAWRTTSKPG